MRRTRRCRAAAAQVLALLAITAASCGSGDDTSAAPEPTTSPSTTSSTTAPTTTATPPVTEAPTTTGGPPSTGAPAEMPATPSTAAPPATQPPVAAAAASGTRCVVRLHGKGGGGEATRTASQGWLEVTPTGNGTGWGGRQWTYFPESGYAAGVAVVRAAIESNGCGRVVIDGFSNGGAFAAKLACRGETFNGTVAGYVVDDPVPDNGTASCAPTRPVVLYWTGGLSGARAGWNCAESDWTCEGGSTIGVEATAANLGVAVKKSVNSGHSPYANPPELAAWLA